MTYPMPPLKHALLPRQEGAGTVGYWRAQMCRQIILFVVACARCDDSYANPTPAR
jgi:hypothetical protein